MSLAVGNALDDLEWTKATEQFTKSARIFERQIVAAGKIKENLPKKYVASMAFDAVDPRATLWADQHAAILVREITDETRSAIQKIILDALNGDYTIDDAGELVSRVIGLTERQAKAVENSYNATIENLVKDGMSRRSAIVRASELAKAYRERLITKRGEMIARTEIMRAANNGRMLSWAQAMDAGLIEPTMQKEWRTFPGYGATGPCPICLELRGVTVPVLSEFPNGALMPPGHPFCRCTAILVPPTRGLPRIAQVGGGYVQPKVDPLGSALASDIRSNEVAKFNPHHDRLGRFSHASGAHMDTGNAGLLHHGGTPSSGWKAAEESLEKTFGKISITGNSDLKVPTDTSPKNGSAARAAETMWTRLIPSARKQGFFSTGCKPMRLYSAQHLGLIEDAESAKLQSAGAIGDNGRPIGELTIRSLRWRMGASYSAMERNALKMHASIRSGKPEQPTLYRGMKGLSQSPLSTWASSLKQGESITLPLSSFSRDPRIAKTYGGESVSEFVALVRVKAGSRGHAVRSQYIHDQEVVTSGIFKITAVEHVERTIDVYGKPRQQKIVYVDIEQTEVPDIDLTKISDTSLVAKSSPEFGLLLVDWLEGFADARSRILTVAKFNPHHDKRGRFARKPGSGGTITHLPTDPIGRQFREKIPAGDIRHETWMGPYEIVAHGDSTSAAKQLLDLTRNQTSVNTNTTVGETGKLTRIPKEPSARRKFRPDEPHTQYDISRHEDMIDKVIDTSPPDTMPLSRYDSMQWTGDSHKARRMARLILSNNEEHRAFIESLPSGLRKPDGSIDTDNTTFGADRLLAHNVMLSAHKAKGEQPTLWRGISRPLTDSRDGKPIRSGDTFDLTPASFTRDAIIAHDFSQAGDMSTIIRVRPGARGVRAVPQSDKSMSAKIAKAEQEVIVQGRFRVVSVSTIRHSAPGKWDAKSKKFTVVQQVTTVIDVEHVGTFDPMTGILTPNATVGA
jgi:hypothetical protein